jgi:hypothetical protein
MSFTPRHVVCLVLLSLGAILPSPLAYAVAPPVVEPFDTGAANWRDGGLALLDFVASGGPDGSSYASLDFNLLNATGGPVGSREATTVVVRAQTLAVPGAGEFVASDGIFFGDWLTDNVGEFRAMVRHSAPEPLSFFARFAGPMNFPGVAANIAEPVQPNTWTELVVPIDLTSPQWALEGSSPVPALMNVGRIQLGFYTPTSLAGIDQEYRLDLDNVTLLPVPEPTTWALIGLAGLGWFVVRRPSPGQK